MKKTLLLSLSLSFLLHAEDDGFYTSAGYQIGEAAQMVKNTKGIQQLSENYEKLNNFLNNYNTLNTLVKLSSDPSAVNDARDNLGSSAKNLLDVKTNSPAYQAVLLALNAAVGLWQVTSYAFTACGPGSDENANGGIQTFNNVPGQNTTTITCNSYYQPGHGGPISTENYAKINQAYQIIQKALTANGSNGDGVPVLSDTTTKLDFTIQGDKRMGGKPNTPEKFTWSDGKYIHTQWINTTPQPTKTKINTENNAQELLKQASVIITTLNEACPNFQNGGNGYWQGISGNGTMCGMFKNEISAIQGMIANAQEAVAQAKIVSENAQNQNNLDTGKSFNPYTDASFAQSMLKNAQAQAEILNQAEQVVKNFEKIPKNFVSDSLGVCYEVQGGERRGTNPGQTTSNTWGAGCAYVGQTITNLKNSIAHFGTQEQQIQQAESIADTLVHFKSRYSELGSTYNSITTALSKVPNAQSLQNAVSKKNNPYSPQGIETNYYLNQNTYNQIQTINQELGRNPFRKVGIVSSQTNNGAMNGIGIQVGYKQFFGQKRKWGARYYGFFDYNHAFIKSSFFNSASDVWTYGFGADALYNFINDKATNFLGKNNKLSVGLFGGIALAGTSWLNSEYVNLATVNNVYNAKMNVANFQFLFNMGVRMNLARPKKKGSDHVAQHGIELGLKIPTINTNYYSFMGAELKYRRLYSVYLNYVFAY
ncbi:Hop family adhesin BabB [Helicobacter pylori]|uniref:Hop family adhesin BabB n=1 Tax=Helicobacter pylori TaxID=210 RepID=UPI00165BD55E|nr:Hop family adhesin BabB [Helicobacter pylori]MBH0235495.1 Hop family adhesin BabB [Helicobacter pylori]MBH0251551.1 Hop family adhesin BabB [Helicobacter pylori]MBH0270731.1 Hop family adhesin BabB [Helicobacter pylori]